MKLTQLVFSPTGGTQHIVNILTENWGYTIHKVDLTNAMTDYTTIQFGEEDLVIIGVPSYSGRVPTVAAERISQIKSHHTNCILVCAYGNRAYEDTLIELKDIVEQHHFNVIAAVAAIAEHSIMHQYAKGRPDLQDEHELLSFSKQILTKLTNKLHNPVESLQIPGNRPYRKLSSVPLVPKAHLNCIECGLCAKNCPTQAIHLRDVHKVDRKKCIACMRCVTRCPVSTRGVNPFIVSVAALALQKACSKRKQNELYI